jgi:hypothetical protein
MLIGHTALEIHLKELRFTANVVIKSEEWPFANGLRMPRTRDE